MIVPGLTQKIGFHRELNVYCEKTGNEWSPLVNARLAFTLNTLTSDNDQNA